MVEENRTINWKFSMKFGSKGPAFFSEKSVTDTDRWRRLRQRTISYSNITCYHFGRMSLKNMKLELKIKKSIYLYLLYMQNFGFAPFLLYIFLDIKNGKIIKYILEISLFYNNRVHEYCRSCQSWLPKFHKVRYFSILSQSDCPTVRLAKKSVVVRWEIVGNWIDHNWTGSRSFSAMFFRTVTS